MVGALGTLSGIALTLAGKEYDSNIITYAGYASGAVGLYNFAKGRALGIALDFSLGDMANKLRADRDLREGID